MTVEIPDDWTRVSAYSDHHSIVDIFSKGDKTRVVINSYHGNTVTATQQNALCVSIDVDTSQEPTPIDRNDDTR